MAGEEKKQPRLRLFRRDGTLQTVLGDWEFLTGSFEEARACRNWIARQDIEIRGCNDAEQKIQHLKVGIVEILRRHMGILKISDLPFEKMRIWAKRMGLNVGLFEFMDDSADPDLPMKNLKRNFRDYTECLWNLCICKVHREQLQTALKVELGIDILGQDAIRVFVFEMNQERLVPHILVLPNWGFSCNPYFALLEGEPALPADIVRMLRLLDR